MEHPPRRREPRRRDASPLTAPLWAPRPCRPRVWATLDAPHTHTAPTLHSRLVARVSNEASERVVRVELLALQLEARRGRGVVGLEPLLDGAALVREAIRLYRVRRVGAR
eukprot:scaffold18991_cov49-Phaeocystis_antarctica.AAC.2